MSSSFEDDLERALNLVRHEVMEKMKLEPEVTTADFFRVLYKANLHLVLCKDKCKHFNQPTCPIYQGRYCRLFDEYKRKLLEEMKKLLGVEE